MVMCLFAHFRNEWETSWTNLFVISGSYVPVGGEKDVVWDAERGVKIAP